MVCKTIFWTTIATLLSLVTSTNNNNQTSNYYGNEWPESINHLFDHKRLMSRQIVSSITHINHDCKLKLSTYIDQLTNQSLWAIKMNDASGRYGGQFFFGNEYWLGSYDLCMELQENNLDHTPFHLHFFVIKLQINLKVSKQKKLSIGFCLPDSCEIGDLRTLFNYRFDEFNENQKNVQIKLTTIRPIPGKYKIFDDIKFRTLGSLTILMIFIVVSASIYEKYTKSKQKLRTELKNVIDPIAIIENNNNLITKLNDEHHKLHYNLNFNHNQNDKNYYQYKLSTFERKSLLSRIILCFSVFSNARKIVQCDRESSDSVTCIHGIRVLSLFWIIMVHTYMELHAIAGNKMLRTVAERYFLYQTVSNATFSVDSFFFISGFLVSLLYFRATGKQRSSSSSNSNTNSNSSSNNNLKIIEYSTSEYFWRNTMKFFKLIIYRFFRLTPVYMFVICIQEISMSYYHNQSVFEPTFFDHVNCKRFWWRNLLYINNLFPQKEICMLWSWYISNDTQFYIISIILLLIATRNLRWSIISLLTLLSCSWIVTFVIAYNYNYWVRIEEPFALFDELYAKPWTRIGSYLIGVITGYFLYKIDGRLCVSRLKSSCLWICSLSTMAYLVYGVGRDGIKLPGSAFYISLGHTAWALSLGWITIACSTGHGKFVNCILSFRVYLPLSRLTYCAYLVHPMLMCITSLRMTGPLQLESTMVIIIYLGNIVISFMVAFLLSLLFEAPILRLLKIIFGKDESKNN